jgi:hypothetical protein
MRTRWRFKVTEFEFAIERVMGELRSHLVGDAMAMAKGGQAVGGIRRHWRSYTRQLSLVYGAGGHASANAEQPMATGKPDPTAKAANEPAPLNPMH